MSATKDVLLAGRFRVKAVSQPRAGRAKTPSRLVQKGFDLVTDRPVIIKWVPKVGQNVSDDSFRMWQESLRHEGEVTALISQKDHPGIVHLVANDEREPLVVLELIEGKTLRQCLDEVGPLSPRIAIELVDQACSGLEVVHEADFVHRDLKPTNLMVDLVAIQLTIIDFSISQPAPQRQSADDLCATQGSEQPGDTTYWSPEQLALKKPVTTASDIYQLGLVFTEMLAGHPLERRQLAKELPQEAKHLELLLNLMLHDLPGGRLTATEVRQHLALAQRRLPVAA